ncbi:hypothetical protein FDP41_001103 [Naegleria fowleri]|uniref:Guanylate cyclase domain-containing protein n=1 Tax=Naegleria fowleri TaxID=5763 RepID=A0A6A5C266_NAEFO|nr:uncharacterized protein FDP41_001103 [Naegleria fowleri]KAF0979950.1 hypothetical protein FDP41_001103 [Naegleria fowleri]
MFKSCGVAFHVLVFVSGEPPPMSPRFAQQLKHRLSRFKIQNDEDVLLKDEAHAPAADQQQQRVGGCLVPQVRCEYGEKKVHLIQGDYLATMVNVQVAKIVLEEQMNICAEVVPIPISKGLELMAQNGQNGIYAMLEYWYLSRKFEYMRYVETEKSLVDAGNLGVFGKHGWFILAFMLEQYPGIDIYREFRTDTAAKYLAENSSSNVGRFIGPSVTWISYENQIISNLKLKLEVQFAHSHEPEEEIIGKVMHAHAHKHSALFYLWYPHFLFHLLPLKDVYLPAYSDNCWTVYNQQHGLIDCDYPTEILKKIITPYTAKNRQDLTYFFSKFSYDSKDQVEMMGDVVWNNMSLWDAACKWIRNNTALVKQWIPKSEPQQNAIIIGTIVGSVIVLLILCDIFFFVSLLFFYMYRKKQREKRMRFAPRTLPISVVFTDIQNSTLLWNMFPEKMKTALEIHNLLMRVNIERFRGYECKTQGDSFMIAFDNPILALGFCLSVQRDLLHANWPLELLDHEDTREVKYEEQLVYRGPRVRIGVHYGCDCEIHKDRTTKRIDYIGNTVNKASKIESISVGGRIYCSEEFIESLKQRLTTQHVTSNKEEDSVIKLISEDNIQFKALGVEKLSGLDGLHSIYWVMDMRCKRTLYIQQLELSDVNVENGDFLKIGELEQYISNPASLDEETKSGLLFDLFNALNNGYYDVNAVKPIQNLFSKLEQVAGITPNELSLIIITHAHFDHAGCVWYFKKHYPHIKVAVPALEADRFRNGDPAPSFPTGLASKILKIRGDRKVIKPFEPDLLFHGGESLEEFGVDGKVLQLKGHTEGGISIVLNNKKAAIINDLMGGGFLKYGKPAYHFFLYDWVEILRNIKRLYEEGFEAFLVTHGYAFTREPLKEWLEKELAKHHLDHCLNH